MTYRIANRAQIIQRLRRTAVRIVDRLSIEFQRDLKNNLNTGASNGGKAASPPGGFPYKNTGALGRSVQISRGSNTGMTITNRVGVKTPYARVLEFGGRITARGKALIIPLNREAKMLRQRTPGSLRGVGDLFLWKPSKGYGGQGFLAKITGKGTRSIKLMFALRKSVTIKARPYMRPTFKAFIPKARQIAQSFIKPRRAA